MQNINTNIFDPISLEEMDKVTFMNRTDTKYCINVSQLSGLLAAVSDDYYALNIEGKNYFSYNTTYFDTPGNTMYDCHLRGKMHRYKIRKRSYAISNASFLEVKFKTNKGKTIKKRIACIGEYNFFSDKQKLFLKNNSPYDPQNLNPVLKNNFRRITLVSKNFDERCTIDFDISFKYNNKEEELNNIAIIELKSERHNTESVMTRALRNLRINEQGFSKYCFGRTVLDDSLKSNAYKIKLRSIKKLSGLPTVN